MTQPPDGVLHSASRANRQPLPKPRTANVEGLQCPYVEVDGTPPYLALKTQAVHRSMQCVKWSKGIPGMARC